jgi:hypothetical protein
VPLTDDEIPCSDAEACWNGYTQISETDNPSSNSSEFEDRSAEPKTVCLSCKHSCPISHFEPTAKERLSRYEGQYGICEACRDFNAQQSMQTRKCQGCGINYSMSYFKGLPEHYWSLLAAAKNADGLVKKCSKCRLIGYASSNRALQIYIVAMCRYEVSKAPLARNRMAQHKKSHQIRGHLETLDPYPHPVKYQGSISSEEDEVVEDERFEDKHFKDDMIEGAGDPVTEYLKEASLTAQTFNLLAQEDIAHLPQQREKEAQPSSLNESMALSIKEREKIRALNESFMSKITIFGTNCIMLTSFRTAPGLLSLAFQQRPRLLGP